MFSSATHLFATAKMGARTASFALLIAALFSAKASGATDLASAQKLFLRGEYEATIRAGKDGAREEPENPEWPLLLGNALSQTGRYIEARDTLTKATSLFPSALRLRLAAADALKTTGATEEAARELSTVHRLASMREWAYRSPADRVALGTVTLRFGGDPKDVLDKFFDPVRKAQPELRDAYLATGQLALDKNDFALAAKTFGAATKKFPEDADAWFGLASAFAPSDSEAALAAVASALKFNPNHVDAWLLLASHHIDSENYAEADKALEAARKINPNRPETHAFRAVVAELRADAKSEATERAAALKFWPANPGVPHLIGRKLSQKYRFAESAALQREALKFDPQFLPAKAQLAEDLLRLGRDDEGWKLVDEVQAADPYDVVAFNLSTLREAMAHFRTLTSEHFAVKMDPREAEIYGADVLALLEKEHALLTKKYGLALREKTVVEIFPDQKDFAIRTFGLPGGVGYLGVCFGRVITANSPAALAGSPQNWQAVLWHEFAHVITLTLTKNKMPRWLSEGISVYEERLARGSGGNDAGTWGERMKPRYRAMILGEDLTPISKLSGAFMKPKTPAHIGFAYYESSLAVEWTIERFGLEKLKRVLADLAAGVAINAALAAHFEPIEKLDAAFAIHARQLASNTGPKLDWAKPPPAALASDAKAQAWIVSNPNNFIALTEQARKLIEARQWAAAKAPLQKLIELFPDQHEPDSAYAMLARAHRELGETDAEIVMLEKVVSLSDRAPEAYERLMAIAAERKDWPRVIANAERYEAVNPLTALPHRYEAEARAALGGKPAATAAFRTLLQLDPPNPADVHFQIAKLLHANGDAAAKREVLLALEETPRFRVALDLLVEIADHGTAGKAGKPRQQ